MQRVIEIISGVFNFFIQFLKRFAIDLYHALYYKAMEFDSELQQTKTFSQRLGIWAAIATVTVLLILLALHLLYRYLSNISVFKGI